MRVHWAVFCRRAIIDNTTNTISLVDVIEEATLPEAPPDDLSPDTLRLLSIPAGAELVILWARTDPETPEVCQCRVRLRLPSGQFVTPIRDPAEPSNIFPIDLTVFRRLRLRAAMPAIPYERPGVYTFVIEEQSKENSWTILYEAPILIVINPGTPNSSG